MKLNVIDETNVETCIASAIVQFGKGQSDLLVDIIRFAAEYFDRDLSDYYLDLEKKHTKLLEEYEDVIAENRGLESEFEELDWKFTDYKNMVRTFIADIEEL